MQSAHASIDHGPATPPGLGVPRVHWNRRLSAQMALHQVKSRREKQLLSCGWLSGLQYEIFVFTAGVAPSAPQALLVLGPQLKSVAVAWGSNRMRGSSRSGTRLNQ